jgi:hypothetical protein
MHQKKIKVYIGMPFPLDGAAKALRKIYINEENYIGNAK